MANPFSTRLPIARECDSCLYLGRGAMGGTGRMGEIFVVVHRSGGEWTHVYRRDERAERTFHLERVAPGDARADLSRWAREVFAIEAREAQAA